MKRLILLSLLLLLTPAWLHASPDTVADVESLFDEAGALMVMADETLDADPDHARSLYAQSAAMYRSCIEDGAIDSADLHANLGNAEFRAGNTGLSIVSYRRAERLDPTNPIARAGLTAARAQVGVLVDPDPPHFAVDALFIWRRWVPRSAIFGAGLISWLALWGMVGFRTFTRAHIPGGWIAASAAVALLTLGAQFAEQRTLYHGNNAVVTASQILGMNGPSPIAYKPTFADPLVAGVECEIIERRDAWRRVRLVDGRTTWLPADAIETI